MSAGKPVRKRENGFANDIQYLNRLRTALTITPGIERNKMIEARRCIDELIDKLGDLHLAQVHIV